MISKIFSALVIVLVAWIMAVFFLPKQSDDFAHRTGTVKFNEFVRKLKSATELSENVTTMSGVTSVANKFGETIDTTKKAVDETRKTLETKVEQTNKVIDSVEKTRDSINELRTNVSDLTTLS